MDTSETPSHENEIANLVVDIVDASKIPAKRRQTSIKPTVEKLVSLIYEHGVLSDTLNDLVDLITIPGHLDQASLASIVKNLYPSTSVSRDIIIKIVACLGHGQLKPALPIQAALLRWVVLVYHVIDHPDILSQAYAVLFNLIDTSAIRPILCHVLALATRRRHVQPFRIQTVLDLSRQTGRDPSLVGLLRVFKDYYPEIIVGDAIRGKASAFKHPDPQWRTRLDEIQHEHARISQNGSSNSARGGFQVHRLASARARLSVIPGVRTTQATEGSVTLEEIDNAAKFVANLEKIDLPNQLVAVLTDPLLQKLLLLRPTQESQSRVANWINSILADISSGDADPDIVTDMLQLLSEYATQMKALPPVVWNFLVKFLPTWDGQSARDALLGILTHVPVTNFKELYSLLFKPLEAGIPVNNSPQNQLAILAMYKALLRNWANTLRTSTPITMGQGANLSDLARHANSLCLALSQTHPTTSTHLAILEFYEENTAVLSDDTLRRYVLIVIPPAPLVYTLAFTQSLAVLSRLCAVLTIYKKCFETAMISKGPVDPENPTVTSATYERAYIDIFNGFLMDICNFLWRSRAFSTRDSNAVGCLLSEHVTPHLESYVASFETRVSLNALFGLSHSPALSLQSIEYVRALEDEVMDVTDGLLLMRHAGPVTQSSLIRLGENGGLHLTWQDYRIRVLKGLEANGFEGIPDLMKNTMKILMNAKAGKA